MQMIDCRAQTIHGQHILQAACKTQRLAGRISGNQAVLVDMDDVKPEKWEALLLLVGNLPTKRPCLEGT